MKILLLCIFHLSVFAGSLHLQVLGSGGPELDERASSSYLIWVDGRARVLVDAGGGSFLRFAQSGARLEDLRLIALTHLHIDHVSDLAAFMKAGFFSDRTEPLRVLGTVSGGEFPDVESYLKRLFGPHGVYAYMQDILTPQTDSFQLIPVLLGQSRHTGRFDGIRVTSVGVHHGPVPALAYAFEIDGKKIVFSGDTSARGDNLTALADGADYLVAHHAIPRDAGPIARQLHMTPERIGEVAAAAGVGHLVLSHRMKRTYGKEPQTASIIKQQYRNEIIWAEDLLDITVK